jgi:hypothetical protein
MMPLKRSNSYQKLTDNQRGSKPLKKWTKGMLLKKNLCPKKKELFDLVEKNDVISEFPKEIRSYAIKVGKEVYYLPEENPILAYKFDDSEIKNMDEMQRRYINYFETLGNKFAEKLNQADTRKFLLIVKDTITKHLELQDKSTDKEIYPKQLWSTLRRYEEILKKILKEENYKAKWDKRKEKGIVERWNVWIKGFLSHKFMNHMFGKIDRLNEVSRNRRCMQKVIVELKEREEELLNNLIKFNEKSERFPLWVREKSKRSKSVDKPSERKFNSIWTTTFRGTNVYEGLVGLKRIREGVADWFLKQFYEKDVSAVAIFEKTMKKFREKYKDAVNYLIRSMVVEQSAEGAGAWLADFFEKF